MLSTKLPRPPGLFFNLTSETWLNFKATCLNKTLKTSLSKFLFWQPFSSPTVWPSLTYLEQISFSPQSSATVKINDGSFNFHQENTEHSLTESKLPSENCVRLIIKQNTDISLVNKFLIVSIFVSLFVFVIFVKFSLTQSEIHFFSLPLKRSIFLCLFLVFDNHAWSN